MTFDVMVPRNGQKLADTHFQTIKEFQMWKYLVQVLPGHFIAGLQTRISLQSVGWWSGRETDPELGVYLVTKTGTTFFLLVGLVSPPHSLRHWALDLSILGSVGPLYGHQTGYTSYTGHTLPTYRNIFMSKCLVHTFYVKPVVTMCRWQGHFDSDCRIGVTSSIV